MLAVLPLLFTGGFALTMLSQMGFAIIFCLAYNMLLGQGGMLSFGHAVYSGLGAFIAIHALNAGRRRRARRCRSACCRWSAASPGCSSARFFGYVTTQARPAPRSR